MHLNTLLIFHFTIIIYKKGSLVEVSSDSDGFNGAWYEAKVLEPPPLPPLTPSNKRIDFSMQNTNLCFVIKNCQKALTECVESPFVRSLNPNDDHDLQAKDVVDAMYPDGWWISVVVKVNQESNIYFLHFENPPELLHFKRYVLRPPWDWEGARR